MKKFLLAALIIGFGATAAQAQTTMTASSSTNTNAATTTHTFTANGDLYNFDALSIQIVGTKTSGTVAGTAKIYGSIDGSNYVKISNDTLAFADQSKNTYIWTFDKTRYKYYQVQVATTGTQVSTWVGYALGRKYPK